MQMPLLKKLELKYENLKAQFPKGQASGEDITINDSSNLEFDKFKISGNSIQNGEPSLENKVDIQNCGDNINLFDKSKALIGQEITGADGTIRENEDYFVSDYIEVQPNTSLYMTKQYGTSNCFYDNDKQFVQTVAQVTGIINVPNNNSIKYMRFNGQLSDLEITKLEKGTVATPWSKFGEGNINFTISNKNLIKWDYRSMNGIIYHDTNKITIKNPTNTPTYLYAYHKLNEIKNFVMGKTVTVTMIVNGTMSNATDSVMTVTIPTNKYDYRFQATLAYKDSPFDNKIYKQTVKLEEDEYPKDLSVFTRDPGSDLEIIVQMEVGQNSTNIITREEQKISISVQEPFKAIGDIRDTFIFDKNKWYEKHIIGRYVLTGDEFYGTATSPNRYHIQISLNPQIPTPDYTYNMNILSNMFIKTANYSSDVEGGKFGHFTLSTNFLIFPDNQNEYTLSTFKAKLKELYNAGTPVYIDYVLAEPELIECTEEQTKILNSLEDLHTYKEITHIFSKDEVSPIFEVEYSKDLEIILTK